MDIDKTLEKNYNDAKEKIHHEGAVTKSEVNDKVVDASHLVRSETNGRAPVRPHK